MRTTRFPLLLFIALLMSIETVSAQPQPPTAALEPVIVKSAKNAAVMPYDDVYDRLKRLQDSKLDRVRLQIKVTPKQDGLQLAGVRVAIVNDNVSVNLPIAADGLINLPLRNDLYKTNAELRSNQPKGSLAASITLGVDWDGGSEIAYAEVEETLRQFQRGGKDLMGWFAYLLFFPSLENFEVPVQYSKANGQTMKVMKNGRVVDAYTADKTGLLKFRLRREWEAMQPTLVFSEAPPKGSFH